MSTEISERRRLADRRYNQSPAGRARHKRYNDSPKGEARRERWEVDVLECGTCSVCGRSDLTVSGPLNRESLRRAGLNPTATIPDGVVIYHNPCPGHMRPPAGDTYLRGFASRARFMSRLREDHKRRQERIARNTIRLAQLEAELREHLARLSAHQGGSV